MTSVAFVGMSHLGLSFSAAFAPYFTQLICYDPDHNLIQNLCNFDFPIYEKDFDRWFKSYQSRFLFTYDKDLLFPCDVVFITKDVEDHNDLENLRNLIYFVLNNMKAGSSLVILSQVPTGFTRSIKHDIDINIYCMLDPLIFGNAITRASLPSIELGCSNPGKALPEALKNAFKGRKINVNSYEVVETAKIAINTYLLSSVAISYCLSDMCEQINVDWADVLKVMKRDKRIGDHAYLYSGLGVGGGHMQRDVETCMKFLGREDFFKSYSHVASCVNTVERWEWPIEALNSMAFEDGETITIWGLSYKPGTSSLVDSPAVSFINDIASDCGKIIVNDPVVKYEDLIKLLNEDAKKVVVFEPDPIKATVDSHYLVIMTPWLEYKSVSFADLNGMINPSIIDPYRVFNPWAATLAGFSYKTLGLNEEVYQEG